MTAMICMHRGAAIFGWSSVLFCHQHSPLEPGPQLKSLAKWISRGFPLCRIFASFFVELQVSKNAQIAVEFVFVNLRAIIFPFHALVIEQFLEQNIAQDAAREFAFLRDLNGFV